MMKSGKGSKLIFMIVGVLLIGGGLFFGGYQVGKTAGGPGGRQLGGPNGLVGGTRGNNSGSSFVSGEVISKDDTSVTVKLADGGSQIIFLSDSTQITKSASGVIDDLVAGTNISANGSENTDGSISAKTVQIRPAGMVDPGQTPPTATKTQ